MKVSLAHKFVVALAVTGACLGISPLSAAPPVQHLSITQPGGMPGWPVMTGVAKQTNGVQLTWDGPSGYYQVFQKSNSLTAPWVPLGLATNLARTAAITQIYSNAFFRVAGPAPKYAGYKVCISCHLSVCNYWTNTAHVRAFADLAAINQQTNPSCLPCHTVGYGLPTGFVSASATPKLEGVQCENCHGPAANHAGSEDDPTIRPRAEVAATVCGGCHDNSHDPTYQEWSSSGHAVVVPDALAQMQRSTNNLRSCGVCHSGTARLALLNGQDPAVTLANDFNMPQTCAVCHDPHSTNSGPAQLRNPLFSTNEFHLAGASLTNAAAFTALLNANTNINLCAQCHNDRGAAWTDTSYPPHHSLQYNMMFATVGQMASYYIAVPSPHSGLPISGNSFYLTNQCADCHLQPDNSPGAGPDHTFTVVTNVCANCHDVSQLPALPVTAFSPDFSNQIASVIGSLNLWAATHAPDVLKTNGPVAWEYQHSDGLAWETNGLGQLTSWTKGELEQTNFNGPSSAVQSSLTTNYPPNILKARFDLYLILNDGSFGVHNPLYSQFLLNSAQFFVEQELYQ